MVLQWRGVGFGGRWFGHSITSVLSSDPFSSLLTFILMLKSYGVVVGAFGVLHQLWSFSVAIAT